jgi:hypothetical protein
MLFYMKCRGSCGHNISPADSSWGTISGFTSYLHKAFNNLV